MKPTSKELLEKASKHCSNQLTYYRFNATTLKVSKKYREGRLSALEYIGELTWYLLPRRKDDTRAFQGANTQANGAELLS